MMNPIYEVEFWWKAQLSTEQLMGQQPLEDCPGMLGVFLKGLGIDEVVWVAKSAGFTVSGSVILPQD